MKSFYSGVIGNIWQILQDMGILLNASFAGGSAGKVKISAVRFCLTLGGDVDESALIHTLIGEFSKVSWKQRNWCEVEIDSTHF